MSIDLAAADSAYVPFRPFSDWSGVELDRERWREHESALEELRGADAELRRKALEVVRRAAAVQTGAVEGLYRADRGFTFTVAAQSALMEGVLARRTDRERALIEDQLRAYEHIVDFATRRVPITEAWIREHHAELCRAQKTYQVPTPQGRQEQLLPLGVYKSMPNHVLQVDGSVHAYAPVMETPKEMERLVRELTGAELEAAHPVLQAAYAHHALAAVHPFADGNGRVARALGSVYTCRAWSLPLLIFEEARQTYFDALASADRGNPLPFVDFVLERCIDAVAITRDSFRAATQQPLDEISEDVSRLYHTRGGYSHQEVDLAAAKLRAAFQAAWSSHAESLATKNVSLVTAEDDRPYPLKREDARRPIQPPARRVVVSLSTPPPADARLSSSFGVVVPKDCGANGEARITDEQGAEVFAARIDELLPRPSPAVELRLAIAVEGLAAAAVSELQRRAERSLRSKGY